MIGTFKMPDADDDATDADNDSVGALAIAADQGTAWGWAAAYDTEAEARRAALDECGQGCTVVVTFRDGCAAYASDQAPGSSVRGWAYGYATQREAKESALDACARRGGTDCIVRAWACGKTAEASRDAADSVAVDSDQAGAENEPQSDEEPKAGTVRRPVGCETGGGIPRLTIQEWRVHDDEAESNTISMGRPVSFNVVNTGNDHAYVVWDVDGIQVPKDAHLTVGESESPILGTVNTELGKLVIGYTDTGTGRYTMDLMCSKENGLRATMYSIDWDDIPENTINVWYFQSGGRVSVESGSYAVTCGHRPGYACGF